MKSRLMLTAAAFTLWGATPTYAGIPHITEQELWPVASVVDGSGLTVCHLVEERSIAYVPYWITSQGYVLSDTGCADGSYRTFTAPISELKGAGLLPADMPETPSFTTVERLKGHAALVIGGVLAAFGGIATAMRGRRRSVRLEILGIEDGPVFKMIDAMCHAAKADGHCDPAEVAYIRDVARELTQLDFQDEHLEAVIERADKLGHAKDFQQFGKGLTPSQKSMILEGVLSVVLADGEMDRREKVFLDRMVIGIGLTQPDTDAAIQRVLSRRAAAVPA